MRTVRAWTAVLLVAGVLPWTGAAPAMADRGGAVTKSEAWYNITPTGGLAGAPALAPPTYGANTLHVGIAAGQETARTYLTFDLNAIASDATVTGGTLVLPIDPGDGNNAADTARLLACAVAQPPPADVAGGDDPPPAYDCSASSTATYQAGDSPIFTIDLSPLANGLRTGGIALVAADGAKASHDTWHVSFFGHHSTAPGAHPITATIDYTAAPPVAESSPTAVAGPGQATGPAGESFSTSAEIPVTPAVSPAIVNAPPEVGVPPVAAAPPGLGGAVTAGPTIPASATRTARRFAYSVALLLPLVLIGLGCVMAWALTRSPVLEEA